MGNQKKVQKRKNMNLDSGFGITDKEMSKYCAENFVIDADKKAKFRK